LSWLTYRHVRAPRPQGVTVVKIRLLKCCLSLTSNLLAPDFIIYMFGKLMSVNVRFINHFDVLWYVDVHEAIYIIIMLCRFQGKII